MPSGAPLLWRLRRPLQRAFAWLAVGTVALGAFVVGHALVVGPLEELGPGFGLLVGGALLFLFDRRRRT
jgi:hypothetical protein